QLKTVTRYMISAKARSLAGKQEYYTLYPDIYKYQFSYKWVDRFIFRHSLVHYRYTTTIQKLPENYAELQQKFLSFVLYWRTKYNYPLNLIDNMDETPMAFNLPSQTTVEKRGAQTISILTTGHEFTNFTITLACLADGTKLPLFIIFKLVNVPREQFPNSIYIHANPSS
ncbi:7233_t:CDS:1, partial [Dentiscutata erythropus]